MRLIDADELEKLYTNEYKHNKEFGHHAAAKGWQGAIQLLYDAPAIAPKTGHIVYRNRSSHYIVYNQAHGFSLNGKPVYTPEIKFIENDPHPYCSVCNKHLDDRFLNFCPNCGAKMEQEEKRWANISKKKTL